MRGSIWQVRISNNIESDKTPGFKADIVDTKISENSGFENIFKSPQESINEWSVVETKKRRSPNRAEADKGKYFSKNEKTLPI